MIRKSTELDSKLQHPAAKRWRLLSSSFVHGCANASAIYKLHSQVETYNNAAATINSKNCDFGNEIENKLVYNAVFLLIGTVSSGHGLRHRIFGPPCPPPPPPRTAFTPSAANTTFGKASVPFDARVLVT